MSTPENHPRAAGWLQQRGWSPLPFQREVWKALAEGRSGLLHADTGAGKTLAIWLAALESFAPPSPSSSPSPASKPVTKKRRSQPEAPPLTVLWITPMRALAADTFQALNEPISSLAPSWTGGLRTGDTAASERNAQNRRLPTLLVTTPESLSLLLARADAHSQLASVRLVVADEWHELIGNKRGVQLQLALARLATWNPRLLVWGMSATLGNPAEALETLLPAPPDGQRRYRKPALVRAAQTKVLQIDTLLPTHAERFPWAGHMGLTMLPQVVQAIDAARTTLVFTNTRSQTERWYQAILERRPDWAGVIALHHGSLDHQVRQWVEAGLKDGTLKAVVCTSSLDLGVDFPPVERVLQIGSPKGVARLLQRAGRSGHAPGRESRISLVPTHSLELVEAAAVRQAAISGAVEARHSPAAPLDVLVQHLVSVALGGGFEPDALFAEVRRAWAYRALPRASFEWALDFVRQGGPSLAAYPDFQRAAPDEHGVWRVADARLARRHRSNIGTIVSDAAMTVQFVGGNRLGSVEESFIARLRPGDVFMFAGRKLELVLVDNMTALVRAATKGKAALPRWGGGRLPLSERLATAMLAALDEADHDRFNSPEMRTLRPLLALQKRWSALPTAHRLLAETLHSREGWHLFLYPFGGRQVHLALASLLAWRYAKAQAATFSIAVNDYGLELLSATEIDWPQHLPALLQATADPADLLRELLESLNASEMARRRFREIARIAGLIFQSHPGEQRSNRQLQASASLYYDVFRKYDPHNQLLTQADAELLSYELDVDRLSATLHAFTEQQLSIQKLTRPTPLAFPLLVERLREKLSTEKLADRIARMLAQLESAAAKDGAASGDSNQPPDEAEAAPDSQQVLQALTLSGSAENDNPARRPRSNPKDGTPTGRSVKRRQLRARLPRNLDAA